jgi:hypothetical protein
MLENANGPEAVTSRPFKSQSLLVEPFLSNDGLAVKRFLPGYSWIIKMIELFLLTVAALSAVVATAAHIELAGRRRVSRVDTEMRQRGDR